jgi:hypothetical protein
MRIHSGLTAAAMLAGALLGVPTDVAAQDPAPAAQPAAQSPAQPSTMQVTQLKNGWLVAPDVKVTSVDDRTATFAGGYGGWVTEGVFLVGGGGYWLANNSSDYSMAYGGLVLEWLVHTDKRIGFGARTLIGGGTATLGLSYTDVFGPVAPVVAGGSPIRFGHRDRHGYLPGFDPGDLTDRSFRVSENFFVAEPQANILLTVTPWMRLNAGVGYRLVGGTSLLEDRLNGVSGTIAVQFGGF